MPKSLVTNANAWNANAAIARVAARLLKASANDVTEGNAVVVARIVHLVGKRAGPHVANAMNAIRAVKGTTHSRKATRTRSTMTKTSAWLGSSTRPQKNRPALARHGRKIGGLAGMRTGLADTKR